jgi:hypothetical protein
MAMGDPEGDVMTDTLDDKFLADKKKEQDEFSDAFDELEGKDPELHKALHGDDDLLNKDDTKGDSLKPEATDTTPEANEADGAVANKEGDAHLDNSDKSVNTELFTGLKKEKPASATPAEGNDPKDDRIAELEAALLKEQQKTSSWDGRIRAANQRAEDAEKKATDFETRLKALEAGTVSGEGANDSGDKNETIAKFFEDFPEFEAPIKALIAQGAGSKGLTLDEVKEAIKPEIEEVKTTVKEQTDQEKFMMGLTASHADVQTYIDNGAILRWIDQQPAYIAKELSRVYNGGTVTEAVTLVDEFKRTSSEYKPTKPEHTNTQKNDKLKSMMAVDSDSAGPPAGQPDKADFDAAADEAFKDE